MAKSYLMLDTRRPLKDGTYPVKIAVGNNTNILLSSGISVDIDRWDFRKQTVIGNKREAAALDSILLRIKNTILELRELGRFDSLTRAQLRHILSTNDLNADKKVDTIYDIAEQFLATKMGNRTIELYRATLDKVRAYAGENVKLDDIKPSWLQAFEVFLGGSANGRAIHLRNLRSIFNFALDEEKTTNYPFRKFKIKHEETRKRSLSIQQLRAYMSLTELTAADREYRDIFMLIFYLIGINITDLAKLTHDSIRGDYLEYRRQKTGKLYSIKLEPEALEIINRYKGREHLLSPFDRYKSYNDYYHHLNTALKRIGPPSGQAHRNGVKIMEPIEPDCSTYWARHTWATLAYQLEIPDETIAAALGHSHGNKITAIYIDKSTAKIDQANRKVIDFLKKVE